MKSELHKVLALATGGDTSTRTSRMQRRIFPALVVIITLLIAVNGYIVWEERENVLTHSATAQNNLVRSMANRLNTTLQKASMLTRLLADDMLDHPERIVRPAYRMRLASIVRDNPDIEMVVMIDVNGVPYVSSLPSRPGALNFSDRNYFRFHRELAEDVLHISEPILSRGNDKRVIPVTRRVNDAQGRFAGVIMIALDSERLLAEFKALDLGAHGIVAYGHLNGTVLVRHPGYDSTIGKNFYATPQFQQHYLREAHGSFTDTSPIDDIDRRYTFERLSEYPVVMVTAISDDDLRAQWLAGAMLKASYLAVLGGLLSAIALYLYRQVGRVAEAEAIAHSARDNIALANKALTETLALNFAILNSASCGIIASDAQGRIVLFNRAAGQLLGYATSEVGHRMTPMAFHDAAEVGKALQLPRLRGTAADIPYALLVPLIAADPHREWTYRRRDGSPLPVQITVSPLADRNGAANGHVTVFIDLLKQKQLEGMKADFVSVVSHELRTPLTSIKGSLSLLRRALHEVMNPGQSRLMDIGIDNCEKLVRLVSDILDLDKMDRQQMTLFRERQPVAPLLARAIALNQPYASQYGVRLTLEAIDDAIHVDVDGDRLQQVLGNLVSNAAKFSHASGTVRLGAQAHGQEIVISVEDQGVGIPKDFQDKVFDRFTQSGSATTRHKPGTGLGMSIARSLVEAHGGRLRFVSTEGVGTTFFIHLPHTHRVADIGAA